jgi:hypothetical protein
MIFRKTDSHFSGSCGGEEAGYTDYPEHDEMEKA